MTRAFADSSYWIARLDRKDALHAQAIKLGARLHGCRVYTSQMVLVEVLNFVAEAGEQARTRAALAAEIAARDPQFVVVEQSAKQFRDAVAAYVKRGDKSWSLTDCASLLIIEQHGIRDVLTHDHHFEQMGYRALLR